MFLMRCSVVLILSSVRVHIGIQDIIPLEEMPPDKIPGPNPPKMV